MYFPCKKSAEISMLAQCSTEQGIVMLFCSTHCSSGFNEFSGIRPDLEKIRPDLNFGFHLKKFTKNGIKHQFGSFKV
jgi:hypothetical protein